jgi:hypothetical protein
MTQSKNDEDDRDVVIKQIKYRKDYLSADKKTALSAEGSFFEVGDIVKHEGAPEDEVAQIITFSINWETQDIIAHTSRGEARISYLYKP